MSDSDLQPRWYITFAAIDDYKRVTGRDMDDDQALIELVPLTHRARLNRTYPNGRQLWRGRALNRRRLRLLVAPPRPPHTQPSLVAILPEHDGANAIP